MIHVRMTKGEYIEANRLILIRYCKRHIVWLLIYCVACVAGLPFILDTDFMPAAVIAVVLLLLGFGVLCTYVYFILPWRFGRAFDQVPLLSAPFSVECSDEGLDFRSEFGESRFPWTHWTKWLEGERLILISAAHNLFHVLRKRCFPDVESIAQFRSMLATKIGSAS